MSLATETNKAESYKATIADLMAMKGKRKRVLAAFTHNAYLTRRELSVHTGIEISSLCSILKDFEKRQIVRVIFSALCHTTGKTVSVYSPVGDEIYEGRLFNELRYNTNLREEA